MLERTGSVTDLLQHWSAGEAEAEERLFQVTYAELHRLARGMLASERRHHTLQPTALLNEAYLRLSRLEHRLWNDRRHFMAVAAKAMRRVLVDHARHRGAAKRRDGLCPLPLEVVEQQPLTVDPRLLALHEALGELEKVDPFKAELVELRFFAGFSIAETAAILGCGHTKVERHWRLAQGWLYRELGAPRGS